jgi:hypothetical protein
MFQIRASDALLDQVWWNVYFLVNKHLWMLSTILLDMRDAYFPNPQRDHLLQCHHNVRNLNILLVHILRSNLKDDVLLVFGNRLLADVLDELAHPTSS